MQQLTRDVMNDNRLGAALLAREATLHFCKRQKI
jgi:hypothetical protein